MREYEAWIRSLVLNSFYFIIAITCCKTLQAGYWFFIVYFLKCCIVCNPTELQKYKYMNYGRKKTNKTIKRRNKNVSRRH